MSKLQLSDLLNTLATPKTNSQQSQSDNAKKATKATEEFLVNNNMKVKQIKKTEESRMKKQMNYKATQQDMDKWIGIVKVNRQKETLDLTNKQKANVNINFFPSKPVSALQSKTDSLLKQLSIHNSASVMKAEQQQLQKLDPEQAKRRLIEARKHRTMVFYEEIKRRRIAKIKSKVYHKIKKRQKLRQEQKRVQTMTPHEKSEYMQKLMKNRIKQRISLRHNSKNKHIQNLLRFSKYNKDGVQQAMNEVNLIRQKQLEKGNNFDEELLGNIEEQYDDQNYRQQAIGQLERELARMEEQQSDGENDGNSGEKKQKLGLEGMKFMQVAREKQQQKDIDDAYKLINQLKDEQSEDLLIDDSDEQQEHLKNTNNKKATQNNSDQPITRKVYGQNIVQKQHRQQEQQQQSRKKQFIKKNIHQTLLLGENVEELTKGLDVQKLKDKYQPERVDLKINQELIEMNRNIFNNNNGLQDGVGNEAVLENLRDFQQDKFQNLQQSIEPQKKRLQGWGSWAGPSIKQPQVDPQAQIRKKLAKIQQIKRKRKDGQLTNVIINQVRNKQLKDYMVQKLPHQFSNVEQFEYMNQTQIGPEWNSLTQFKSNIKPKVITKVGEVIQPIRAPKKINKL